MARQTWRGIIHRLALRGQSRAGDSGYTDQRPTAAKETEGVWLQGRGKEGFLEVVTPELRLENKSNYPRTGVGMGVSRGTWQMRTIPQPQEMAPWIIALILQP